MPRWLPLLALCACAEDAPIEQLDFLTTTLPGGRVGDVYAARLEAAGGSGALRFGLGGGALPEGLTLSTDGAVEGTPTDAGTFGFSALVQDTRGHVALRSLEIVIDRAEPEPPAPLRWLTSGLPVGEVGAWYEVELRAEGGVPPHRFAVTADPLPPGLELGSDEALVFGTPERAEVTEVEIELSDAAGSVTARTFELRVVPAVDLVTELLPIGQVGVAYEATLETTGGAFPVGVEAFSGELPAGLSLDASGRVSGIPTEVASRPVRFRATDGLGAFDEQRIRVWVVDDAPIEEWVDREIPGNCGLLEATTVSVSSAVDSVAMLTHASFAVDLDYADIGMLEVAVVAPDGTRVLLHRGGARGGGGIGLHYMFEDDTTAWGSLLPLEGLAPAGPWTLEVTVLPDPGFRCVEEPGRLQRFSLVLRHAEAVDEYLRVAGWSPNNMIDGAFARIAGGGLPQSSFDLSVELWSSGPNGLPEGGTGDDEQLADPAIAWSTDLPAEVGVLDPGGAFMAGEQTGSGTMTGTAGEAILELPVSVVPPDWVP